jgi:hypothetical protein|tara:strand:+ start:804 stop:1697 length:894 start_codon:yes stop_codon:yes gene_type:complete
MALYNEKYGTLPADDLPEGSYQVAGPLIFLENLAKKLPEYKPKLDEIIKAEEQGFDIWKDFRSFREPISDNLTYDTGTAYTGVELPSYRNVDEILQDSSGMTLQDYLGSTEAGKLLGQEGLGVNVGRVADDDLVAGVTIRQNPNEKAALYIGPNKNNAGRWTDQELIDHEVGHVMQEKFGMPIGTNSSIALEWLKYLKSQGRISDEVFLNATRKRNPAESLTGDWDYNEGYRTSMGEALARAGANVTQKGGDRPTLQDFAEDGFPIARENLWEFFPEDVKKAKDWRTTGGWKWEFKP